MRKSIVPIIVAAMLWSCGADYVPKPRGYYRFDFPEKKYQVFSSDCPYEFEMPIYGKIESPSEIALEKCWYNISFPKYNAKVHLTYVPLNGDLAVRAEDIRTLVYKHVVKANNIEETRVVDAQRNVYGIFYSISGNTASSLSFLLTDSTDHFLSGSLYFSSIPNSDSLAPAIDFFTKDIEHLAQTLVWK